MMQLGYGEEGGCPFKHFDDASFQGLMDIEEIVGPQREEIALERQKEKYNIACKKYLHAKQSQISRQCDRRRAMHQSGKKSSYNDGSWESGTYRLEPEVTGGISKDGFEKQNGLVSVSPIDLILESNDSLIKKSDDNSWEMKTNDLQHTRYGSECLESSLHKHSNSCQPSLNVDPASVCDSSKTSCHIANEEIATVGSRTDFPCKYDCGDIPLLQCKSSIANDMCKGSKCSCPRPLSMPDGTMSKSKIEENALKRGSTVTSEDGRKVPKMTSALKESNVIMESVRTNHEADVKEKYIIHESKSVIAPSFERDVVESPLDIKSREEVSSSKIKLEEDLSGLRLKVEELSILRPSNFYYSFRRMLNGLNQDKLG